MTPEDGDKPIDASPTKSFFIDTLVKDIDLIDAVLDLVDNSIDGHITNNIQEKRRVSIQLTADRFVLEDYCGGIPKKKISDHVFRLGKPSEEQERTIGVYGIGLKRAIFKIGRNFLLESDDGTDFYSVRIDDAWLRNEENWRLSFEVQEGTRGTPLTRITITDMYPDISDEINKRYFVNSLKDRIKDTYSLFMEKRVDIEVNGETVGYYEFNFLEEEGRFAPFHKKYSIEDVEVEIFAGYTPKGQDEPTLGWFVFCNDRLIIGNDTTDRTGWGYGDRKYHYPEDDRFLGLVFFRSDNPISLPWQTTKDDVQIDSRVYRQAQKEMQKVTKRFIDVIRLAGRTRDPETEETIGRALFVEVPSVSWKEIREEQNEVLPIIEGELVFDSTIGVPTYTYVQYTVKVKTAKKVKRKLGNQFMSNKKMGEKTLQYYIEMEEIEGE